jgi:hypothetical protein
MGETSYGLRRQAERDAALDPANLLGCHAKALSPLRSASAVQKLSPFSCGCFYLQTRLNLVVTVQPHPPSSNQDNTQERFWEWLAASARLKNDLKPASGRS